MKKTAFISHPDTLLHVMDGSHPESPARISAIKNAVMNNHVKDKLSFYNASSAKIKDLERVHDPLYVQHIHDIAPKAGLVRLDADTAMGPMGLSATLHASGAVLKSTDLVMQEKVHNAFCCIRPPGHHAGRANSAGFCIFNHVAVGASPMHWRNTRLNVPQSLILTYIMVMVQKISLKTIQTSCYVQLFSIPITHIMALIQPVIE